MDEVCVTDAKRKRWIRMLRKVSGGKNRRALESDENRVIKKSALNRWSDERMRSDKSYISS